MDNIEDADDIVVLDRRQDKASIGDSVGLQRLDIGSPMARSLPSLVVNC